jgi:small subunit ribosomal protein S20
MAQATPTKVKKRKKSVLKRAAKSLRLAEVNRGHRTRVRSSMKSLRTAIRSGDAAAAGLLLRPTLSAIDRAVAKGILTRNSANRYKSRLSLACNALAQAKKA